MAGPLKEKVEQRLPWLFQDLGFRVIYQDYSEKRMGDSVVEMQSNTLRIRFIRDRGIISVQLSSLSEPQQWMELEFLWDALTGTRPEPALEGWGLFLRDHLFELTKALGPDFVGTKQKVERKEEEGRQALARYVPPITTVGRLRRFKATPLGMILMGPFGWIAAAGLIGFWLLTR